MNLARSDLYFHLNELSCILLMALWFLFGGTFAISVHLMWNAVIRKRWKL